MELRTEGTGNSHTCLPGSRLPTSARASSDPRGQSTALRASSADTPRNVKFIFSVPAPKPLGKTLTGRAPLRRPLQNQAAGAPGQDHVFSGLIQTCNKVREGSCVCTCVCVCVCVCVHVFSCSVASNSLRPQGLQPTGLVCSQNFPGKNTGVACHFSLQGIFLTQGLNPCLLRVLHW